MLRLVMIWRHVAVAALETAGPVGTFHALVITHLTPRRIPSLRALLEARAEAGAKPLEVYLSNPALQALRSSLGPSLSPPFLNVSAAPHL